MSALVKALPMRRIQQAAKMAKLEAMPIEKRRERRYFQLVHVGMSRRRMRQEEAMQWARAQAEKDFPR